MKNIEPQTVLECIRHMLPPAAAGKLPPVLFHMECPKPGCGGYLNYRGEYDGIKVFDCQRCNTPFLEAPALFDLTDQAGGAVQPDLLMPRPEGNREPGTQNKGKAEKSKPVGAGK